MAGATAIMSVYQEAQAAATKDRQRGIDMYNQIGEFSAFTCPLQICLVIIVIFGFYQFIRKMA